MFGFIWFEKIRKFLFFQADDKDKTEKKESEEDVSKEEKKEEKKEPEPTFEILTNPARVMKVSVFCIVFE